MTALTSRVGPKGQVTIPAALRRMLGLKPRDQVAFIVENGHVRLERARVLTLDDVYRSVPALPYPISDEELIRQAVEEHIDHMAQEGLD